MPLTQVNLLAASCSTSAGFKFVVAGGWHSALSGVLASIVFVAIVFVLTNDPPVEERQHERGPALRVLFVTFFVFLVASFLWSTVAGFGETVPDRSGEPVPSAIEPVLAVPAAWLLSIGAALLFFAICWLVSAYEGHRIMASDVSRTAIRCFRLIAWLTAVEVWIAIETATRSLAGLGWWYSPAGVAVVAVLAVPFLFADRIVPHVGREGALGRALGFIGIAGGALIVFFAAVSGQPDSSLLHEGNWCAQGLPWGAGLAAVVVMGVYLVAIAALARALPAPTDTPT